MNSTKGENWRTKITTAVLFLFLAVPGVFIFLTSSLILFVHLFGGDHNLPHPLKAGAFCIVGMFLMLIGLGKWKQWRYLLVFISMPTAIFGALALVGKGGIIFLPIFALPILFMISRMISERYKTPQQSEKLKE